MWQFLCYYHCATKSEWSRLYLYWDFWCAASKLAVVGSINKLHICHVGSYCICSIYHQNIVLRLIAQWLKCGNSHSSLLVLVYYLLVVLLLTTEQTTIIIESTQSFSVSLRDDQSQERSLSCYQPKRLAKNVYSSVDDAVFCSCCCQTNQSSSFILLVGLVSWQTLTTVIFTHFRVWDWEVGCCCCCCCSQSWCTWNFTAPDMR